MRKEGIKMATVWDSAVARDFVDKLISRIKELKQDCCVDSAWDIKEEVGEVTIELINETYEDI